MNWGRPLKEVVRLAGAALLASSCGPMDDDRALVRPVAAGLSTEVSAVHPTVACSGESCRGFNAVAPPRAQQGLSSLNYSTYLGFGGNEWSSAVAVDPSGNAYVAGTTTTYGGAKPYVAKMSPTGQMVYFTYFSIDGDAKDIAVDGSGNAYVVAEAMNGQSIVAKLNPSGSAFIYYQTVPWVLTGIAVDPLRNAYLLGNYMVDVSTQEVDVIVSKLNSAGTAFVYSVAFGGTSNEITQDIAVDGSGNAYVTGWTGSYNYPVWNAVQATKPGGMTSFVTKLNAAGTALIHSTYLGTPSGMTYGTGIAVDGAGNTYVTGSTQSGFPVTPGAAQTVFGGAFDRYVAKLYPTGGLAYATYLGGSDMEDAYGSIAVDSSSGIAYVAGHTSSSNFPVTSNAFQSTNRGGHEVFITQLSPSGSAIWYSTYLGGSFAEYGREIALDSSRNVYVTGDTDSTYNFPTNVYAYGGGATDAFITKLYLP